MIDWPDFSEFLDPPLKRLLGHLLLLESAVESGALR